MATQVKREKWKSKGFVYTVRDNGKLISWKKSAKGFTLLKAQTIYKQNRSFQENITKTRLRNVSEYVVKVKSVGNYYTGSPGKSRRIPKESQYFVSGMFKGREITARSYKIGTGPVQTRQDAYKNAWESFLMRLSQESGGKYDEDEGYAKLGKVKDIREGWVYYK